MAALNLTLLDDDPWPINKILFSKLNAYLQPNSQVTTSEVAETLDSLFPSHRKPEDQPAGKPLEPIRDFFYNIWEPFHIVAQQLPFDSPEQEKLVSCLKEIQRTTGRTPVVEFENTAAQKITCRLWQDMYYFAFTFDERSRVMYNHPPVARRNLMAYAARLTRDNVADLSYWGIGSMYFLQGSMVPGTSRKIPRHYSLEFTPGQKLDESVAEAADWISSAGKQMFQACDADDEERIDKFMPPGWMRKEGVSHQRWSFWAERLGQLSADERVSEATRILAKEMKQEMEQIAAQESNSE